MRAAWLTLLAASLAANISAATIGFEVADLGGGEFQYTYMISGVSFQANQTLDISFDPAVYSALLGGQAGNSVCDAALACTPGTDWSLQMFQVNTPPGAFGDYFATALVNNPSLAGPFTANFTLQAGARPGSQPFQIFDANFNVIESGSTTPVGGVPEPATFTFLGIATLMGGISYARRRRA